MTNDDDGLYIDAAYLDESETREKEKIDELSDNEIESFFSERAFRVIHQTNNFLLPQIAELIEDGEIINIRPEYQRRLRWNNKQKSAFIESLLLNIPIPPIFLYESDYARYEVMDGQQRLNAIKEFIGNEFPLSPLEILSPLRRKRYQELPPKLRRGIDRASISAIVLLRESESPEGDPMSIRRQVFERLNRGGQTLNHQELRNAIYRGRFNDLIIELTRDQTFTEIWGIPPYTETDANDYYENPRRQKNTLYKTMGDCQIVLRFFALRNGARIEGSMQAILDRAMQQHQDITEAEVEGLKQTYRLRLRLAYELFDGNPFRLTPDEKGRQRASVPLYDAVMVALDNLWEQREHLLANAEDIRNALDNALLDYDQYDVFVGRANTAEAVRNRISEMHRLMKSCI